MKRYILFGLTMMMAFPAGIYAQNEAPKDTAVVTTQKKAPKKQSKKKVVKEVETRTVRGSVVDAITREPIEGALIQVFGIKGYSVLSDEDGNYEVDIPVFATSLYVTSPNYNPVTVGLTDGEMQRGAHLLSDAFTPDYSTDVNVRGDKSATDFQYTNALNIKEEIQKQLGAYVFSTQRSGTPGIGSNMYIQGLNSLNSNAQPLVVVDGVIQDQQYGREMIHSGFVNDILSNINPADIAEVNIIRNGTALYGARGANGIIEINTRRSQSMATRITANIAAGVTFEPKYYSMMDAEQYRGYASTLLKGVNTSRSDFKFLNADPNYYYYNQYHNNTDWKDQVYHNALTQNYGINVEGGDEVAKYDLSVGYTSAESTMEYNNMHRLHVRFNTDISLSKMFDVKFDASFSNITRNIRDDGAPSQYDEGTPTAPSFLAYVKSPFISPYSYGNGILSDSYLDITDETYLDEALASYSGYNYKLGNPVAFNEYADAQNKNRFENSLLNIAVTPRLNINKHLALSELFSYSLVNTNNKYYIPINGVPTYYVSSVYGNRENQVSSLASKQNSVQSDTRLSWHNTYDAHDIAFFVGARINWESYKTSNQLGYNTGSDKTPFMSSSLMNAQSTGVDESWRNLDAYLQADYSILGRYFAKVNLTASGSSRFGKDAAGALKAFGTVWGIFPSVQTSWIMTNEPWFAKNKYVNRLKLNLGFDMSGNDDIDVYASRSYFASSLYLNAISGLSFAGIGNTSIKWETTKRLNLGAEANLFDSRLCAELNLFASHTSNLLALREVAFLSGISENWANNGSLENYGFDFSLRGKAITAKNWHWELGASVGHYTNRIKDLGLSDGKTSYTTSIYNANILTQEGKAANLFYGYRTKGVFSTTAQANEAGLYILDDNGVDKKYFEAGDIIFDDVNGDHEINEKDMVVIGDPNPDFYGNIFSTLTFKRLKLDINFSYCVGNDVYNYMRQQLESGSRFMNQTTALTNRWMVEGQVTNVPRASFQDPMENSRFSDRWIEDGSYLKLKSVTLSYVLPINSTFIQGLQFWVQGNNLFTLTKYLGTDPECSVTGSVIGQGIDYGRVAQSRSIVAGIKINL